MIKVKDEPNLSRDKTGVIHNTAIDEYREYITKRNQKLELENRLSNLEATSIETHKLLNSILLLLQDKK